MPRKLFAFAIALLVCTAPSLADTTGSIIGNVKNWKDEPYAHAYITAESGSQRLVARSDSQGRFVILDLAPGMYDLFLSLKPDGLPYGAGGIRVSAGCQTVVRLKTVGYVSVGPAAPKDAFWFPQHSRPESCGYAAEPSNNPYYDSETRVASLIWFLPGVMTSGPVLNPP